MSRARSNAVVGAAVAGLVVLACGQIAGIEDPPSSSGGTGTGTGTGTTTVEISPENVTFGTVDCGNEGPGQQVISIANTGSAAAEYKVELPDGTPFRLDGPLTGKIEPGAPAVTVRAFVKPNTPSDITTDVLVSVGPVLRNVHLAATGRGAAIEWKPQIAPIGDVRMQSGGSADVLVQNTGTAELVISGFDGLTADFTVPGGGAMSVAPGGAKPLTVTLIGAQSVSNQLTTQLVPKVQGALCGAPGSVLVTGRRVNSNVTISSGDFGKQPCNTTPTKDVVIKNYSTTDLPYTASLPDASPFTIVSGAAGTVPKSNANGEGEATIKLAPKASLTNLAVLTDTLAIDIKNLAAPDGGLRNVPVSVDVRGAILNAQPATISDFKYKGDNNVDWRKIVVSNTGNEPVGSVSWNLTRTQGDPAWLSQGWPGSLSPGASTTGTYIGFYPARNCPCEYVGTPTAGSGGPICNTLKVDFKGNY